MPLRRFDESARVTSALGGGEKAMLKLPLGIYVPLAAHLASSSLEHQEPDRATVPEDREIPRSRFSCRDGQFQSVPPCASG